jgi:hypothetical protein
MLLLSKDLDESPMTGFQKHWILTVQVMMDFKVFNGSLTAHRILDTKRITIIKTAQYAATGKMGALSSAGKTTFLKIK